MVRRGNSILDFIPVYSPRLFFLIFPISFSAVWGDLSWIKTRPQLILAVAGSIFERQILRIASAGLRKCLGTLIVYLYNAFPFFALLHHKQDISKV